MNPKLAEGEEEMMRAKIQQWLDQVESPFHKRRFRNLLELTQVSWSKCGDHWEFHWVENSSVAMNNPDMLHFIRASLLRQLDICIKILEQSVKSLVQGINIHNRRNLVGVFEKAEELGYGDDDDDEEPKSSYKPEYNRAKTALYQYLMEKQSSTSSTSSDITLEEVEAKTETHILFPCRELFELLKDDLYSTKLVYIRVASEVFKINAYYPMELTFWLFVCRWCNEVLHGFQE